MPLSRLENFLINTDGNILYVNPSDLDATDSFDNKGNSLTRPFKTIQRALLEAARFAYQSGQNNDRFDRTTILLYPGEHIIDNRPGLSIAEDSGVKYYDVTGSVESTSATYLDLSNSTIFDLNNSDNILAKFNSVHGGVIVPKGTSIVGFDLRKTKVRPLYVPNPDVDDSNVARSAIFRVTGGCYFWQFSIFDANQAVYYSKNFNEKRNPAISHHKLTAFEYADGLNKEDLTGTSDLQQYYYKLMNAYGANTGNRTIPNFPTFKDFEPNTSEFKIVGDLRSDDNSIQSLTSSGTVATVTTINAHGLTVDDPVRIAGISSTLYEGSYRVSGISSERQFSYVLLDDANDDVINPTSTSKVVIEADNVTGASPYIFNCSLRSVYGMCGMHCDGSKATGFKSMVVAQFTGIGLQKDDNAFVIYNKTTGDYDTSATVGSGVKKPLYINQDATYKTRYKNYHIKATNDAVIQAVSTFAIGFANQFVSESGGEQSITNSNSNFGAKALISHGFRKNSFDRDDTGYITHIVPPKDIQNTEINVIWRLLNPSLMAENIGAGGTSKLYIDGATDKDNPPNNITNGFRVGSKKDEKVYIDTLAGGANVTYESPILMTAPSGEGPSSEKRFNVARTATQTNDITSNEITLVGTHNFFTGESVRVYSDDGRVPDGLENGSLYYVVSTGTSTIKLATTFNNALAGTPVVTISNQKGGVVSLVSRVTDKLPGEFGHPIQWDTGKSNWYITGTDTTNTNSIYEGIVGFSTDIAANNSSLYVRRVPETRALSDRIYKLRYVIPSSYTSTIAKKPEKNYILQESKTVGEESTIQNVISNRNPRIISGITTDSANAYQANVVSETPHGLSIGDKVRIKNVKSTTNTTGVHDEGYNGYYSVTKVTSTRGFSYISSNLGGTFDNTLRNLRITGGQGASLPAFERNEYDTTYTIQEVETLQDYVSGSQDGIYYLTCLLGNVRPTVSEYSNLKFKQNITQLYPTVDKDNATNDPQQSVTAASNSLIGKVVVNDPLNSITKETAINYLRDNRVGYAVTFAESKHSGITTIFSDTNHSLNSVTNVSITTQGVGYSPSAGVATEYYNANLVGTNIVGDSATANVVVSTAGAITAVQIVDGGSAYGIGNTMVVSVPSLTGGVTTNAIVEVTGISNNIGDVVQVIGVGTLDDRNNGYDGAYKITDIPSAKSITYTNVSVGQTIGSNVGIYTGPVGVTTGIFFVTDEAVGFSEIVGVANTSVSGIVTVTTNKAHGLSVGNRIQIAGLVGTAATVYNGYNFIVKEKVGLTTFTFNSTIGIPTTGETGAEVYKLGLQSYGQSDSLEIENISENLIPLTSGISTTMSAGINTANTNTTLSLSSYVGMSTGDFLQVDNEVMRIKSKSLANGNDVTVIRGVLGTKSVAHDDGSVVRNIKVVPSETHRFSSVRASGHTFEYVGYGPGNYSTALPVKQTRALTAEEEILSNSKEENGGVVFYSGMNDRGDFFTGERATARENFLGELTDDSATATFDDVYIRNTLRVGGGPNRNLPSEFSGPVNFTNKLTSTSLEGIEALKIAIKGTALNNPYFVVGPEANPSFVINKASQFVGIKNASPAYELDVNGSIRANVYENFKLSDLPIGVDEEVTFGRNKVLKVNNAGTGYELVDPHELDAYRLRSYNISNDGSVYSGMGEIVDSKLVISGISTAKFNIGERVKMFGVTKSSDTVTVDDPVLGSTVNIASVPTTGADTTMTYYYWEAQYHYRNGKVGISSQISPTGTYVGTGARPGIANTTLDNFNDLEHNVLSLSRTDANHGLLIYRQNYTGSGTEVNADRGQAKLIAVLGQKELGSDTANIIWKDYGVYEQTEWSAKGTVNEFIGFHTSTVATNQIHFPCIGTEGQRRGWDIDSITAIGSDSITVSGNYLLNDEPVGFGTTAVVKVVHENTKALAEAIADTVASGGNYLDLPSGTYLSNQIVIPTNFTLTGEGKNTFLKQQYYATDQTDLGSSGGTTLPFNGTFIGIGTTLGKDVTISNLTIDGNGSNNLTFVQDVNNYLVYMRHIESALFKDIEIRNTPASGLFLRDSNRVSVENSTFVDGGQTDRFPFQPLDAQNSSVIRVNDNLFENYPGPVDLSVTSVVSTGGNIIRNCGSGLESYATGKITTQNNIILGPSDEWIPSPDIYDSDWDSINVTIEVGKNFEGPKLLYLEDGEPKNISDSRVSIVAGIGTMIGLYSTTTPTTLGEKFLDFDILTQDTEEDGTGRDNGYIQLHMPPRTEGVLRGVNAGTYALAGSGSSALGYEIVGTGFLDQPSGFGTYVGIYTGFWANNDIEPAVGTGCTQYIVTLTTPGQISGICTGDIVKLPGHQMSPNISSTELIVQKKWNVNPTDQRVVLTTPNPPTSYTSISNGVEKGYISIRKVFTIAKGRVGVE